jgi:hypothetical protein
MVLKHVILGISVLLCLTSCSYKGWISDKMGLVEGEYSLLNRKELLELDDSFFPARIVEVDKHWLFSCVIPVWIDGEVTLHQLEQELVWSPEFDDYLFVSLPESDLAILRAGEVTTRFNKGGIEMALKDHLDRAFIVYKWRKP